MSTYLQLCQDVARESRTVSGSQPSTVSGQTGRLLKIVKWTNLAYLSIQTSRKDWQWLRGEFSGSLTAGTQRYAGSVFVPSRFGNWINTYNADEDRYWIRDPAIGLDDDGQLHYWPWEKFYATRLRGTQQSGKPSAFSIAPDRQIVFADVPDKTYTVTGPYRKSAQTLSTDGDEPEMDSEYHNLIVEVALDYLFKHDESFQQMSAYQLQRFQRYNDLIRDYTPQWEDGPVFA